MMFVSALNIHFEQTSKITHRWYVYGLITTCQSKMGNPWLCVYVLMETITCIHTFLNEWYVSIEPYVSMSTGANYVGQRDYVYFNCLHLLQPCEQVPCQHFFNVRLNASMSKVNVLICTVVLPLSI